MNWIELKALNTLSENGRVKLNETLARSGEINYLINSLGALDKTHNELFTLARFTSIYERDYSDRYNKYTSFLIKNNLLKPQIRFEENDIKTLINIQSLREGGMLDELRKQIIDSDESLRGVSLMFFRNEKYLDDRHSLINALKQILDIEHFSNEKDQQYIYKLECHNPKAIILCENLDFLTKPNKPRQYGIELWYAGGKNITKLQFADSRGLPIYYSCDWDYDGLFIIYPLVKNLISSIQLLSPDGPHKGIKETEHNSKWKEDSATYINDGGLFKEGQVKTIKELINKNCWIIEESNSLVGMYNASIL